MSSTNTKSKDKAGRKRVYVIAPVALSLCRDGQVVPLPYVKMTGSGAPQGDFRGVRGSSNYFFILC